MNHETNRRGALKCLGLGAGTLFTLSGGVLNAISLDAARAQPLSGTPLFVQLSDTHIGFNKEANPDVAGTLNAAIDRVNALPVQPPLILHTGDVTHLSRAAEFDQAQQLMSRLKVTDLHFVPGEHDVTDGPGTEFFNRFGAPSKGLGYYSFDANGVHFVALNNVMHFKPGGLSSLGDDQLAWLKADLAARPSSQPIVIFAHMPLWDIYAPWGWGCADAQPLADMLRPFGSVTVLCGHIHQIVSKVEGNVTFHTARALAYPQPAPGSAPAPGPMKVPADQLRSLLGVSSVSLSGTALTITDTNLS